MSSRQILSLYRRVLRLHQVKLEEIQKSIGDQYVRQEFRAHLDSKPEHQEQFLEQWEEYASHLSLEADLFGVGRDLADGTIESLSDDQRMQLQKLQESARSINLQSKVAAGENPYEETSK